MTFFHFGLFKLVLKVVEISFHLEIGSPLEGVKSFQGIGYQGSSFHLGIVLVSVGILSLMRRHMLMKMRKKRIAKFLSLELAKNLSSEISVLLMKQQIILQIGQRWQSQPTDFRDLMQIEIRLG
jgi:hypothetical protein